MTFMSKEQLRQHLLSAPPGTTPGGIVAALRAQGVQMEGDPTPVQQQPQTRTPGAFSYEEQIAEERRSPIMAVQAPFKQVYNFGVNTLNMAEQAIGHPVQTIDSMMGTAAGGITDAVVGAGKMVGIQPKNVSPDQQKFRGAVDQYATNYGVNDFAKGDIVGGINQINKTLFETPAQAAMDYYGAKSAVSGGLQAGSSLLQGETSVPLNSVAAKLGRASQAVENFRPAEHFLNDVMGPVVDKTPFLGKITRGYGRSLDAVIDEGISKGIRPTVAGKESLASRERYTENSRSAVKTIVQNKDQLQLLDENGQPLPKGTLPQNLDQFSQALDQTKTRIFKEYNDLQVQAGQKGLTVKLDPLVSELMKVADDPTIQDLAPGVAEYAKARATALSRRAQYTPEQAQAAAQTLNAKLQAFYKNPNPNDLSVSVVDALIKNHLVEGLDNAVLEATNSPSYMPLRQRYGALKAIEKDLNHRAVVFARQSNKGFFDLSTVFSYGDIVKGIASQNAPLVAKGLFQKAVAEYFKFRNNPNTIIRDMFQNVDRGFGGQIAAKTAIRATTQAGSQAVQTSLSQ